LASYVDALGPAVVGNLARTARMAAAAADVLGALAAEALDRAIDADGALRTDALATLPPALRGRVLRGWALSLGVPGSALSHRHIEALEARSIGTARARSISRARSRWCAGTAGYVRRVGPKGRGAGKATTQSRPRDTPMATYARSDS
jgi:hypothetical protein